MPQAAPHPRHWFLGMVCAICGTLIAAGQAFNTDHTMPLSRGGRRGRANKELAHILCNAVKGNRYPFSLRTTADREAARSHVTPRTYRALERIWAGEAG